MSLTSTTTNTLCILSLCLFCVYLQGPNAGSVEACTGLSGMPSIPAGGIPSVGGGGGGPTGGHGSKEKGSKKKRCLHTDTPVLMADGRIWTKAGDLVIGDRVWNDDDGGTSTPVVLIPVQDPNAVQDFVRFQTSRGHVTTLTPDHAVLARPCDQGDLGDRWPIKKSIDLQVGQDCVPTAMGQGEDRVVSVELVQLKGRVQPITASGKIVVGGGVVVSCYDYNDYDGQQQQTRNDTQQEQRHSQFEPMRVMYNLAEKIYNGISDERYAIGMIESLIRGAGLEKIYFNNQE